MQEAAEALQRFDGDTAKCIPAGWATVHSMQR